MINARLGSTRLPKKLIRPFADTTLIDIALEKLDRLDFFTNRYFAAAEDELLDRTVAYTNIINLRRDPESVLPGYGRHEVIYRHYSRIESDFIFWLNPCHALLSIETIREAVNVFHNSSFNSYTSVVPTRDWIFQNDGLPITHTKASMLSTNHSDQFLRASHSFHIFSRTYFQKNNQVWSFTKDDPHLIPIPSQEDYDCDTLDQFELAEIVYRRQKLL